MPAAQPSVTSSMWRVTWVTSVTPSKSMEGKESPASQGTVLRPSGALSSRGARPSTAQTVSAELPHIVLEVPTEVKLHVQALLSFQLPFFKQQSPVLSAISKHIVN